MRRATAALAVLMLAGGGALAATPASAADTPAPAAASALTPQAPNGSEERVARGEVVSRLPLNIRERPNTHSPVLGSLRPHTIVTLACKVRGEDVEGNDLWYRLDGGWTGYVSARYVDNFSPVSFCRY
ncbi:SH3 domain-containing protein [Streptomyces sp. NPDC088725]|uniref:SH3 domain-containing protein n=1 Tax=Streptomyces sp. NPDC088725 TaxID=3365873 RepID=UPI00380E7BE5